MKEEIKKKRLEDKQIQNMKDDHYYFRNIENPSERLQLEAIKIRDGEGRFIPNPSDIVQIAIVTKNAFSLADINNKPCKKALEIVAEYLADPNPKLKVFNDRLQKLYDEKNQEL